MIEELRGIWRGETVACIASGPSLRQEDCDAIQKSGICSIVVNTSYRKAPFADILYAMDPGWWRMNHEAVLASGFRGQLWGSSGTAKWAKSTQGKLWPVNFSNSGSGAISMAVVTGAKRVLLTGYDCQLTGGKKHWHDDHPFPLSNAQSVKSWPYQFSLVAKYAAAHSVKVINCTRSTALLCFPRGDLREELER